MRLFIGSPVPGHEALAAVTGELRHNLQGFRPVPLDSWHVTLRFLGEADPASTATTLESALRGRPPIPIRIAGIGAFPEPAQAQVVWAGVETGTDEVNQLVEAVRSAFPGEERPFHAHVTLGRMPAPADIRPVVGRFADAEWGRGALDRVVLWRSHLGRGGPRYESLRSIPLRADSGSTDAA